MAEKPSLMVRLRDNHMYPTYHHHKLPICTQNHEDAISHQVLHRARIYCCDSGSTQNHQHQGETIIRAEERNGLHYIEITPNVESNSSITLEQAHRRFGHSSDQRLKHISTSTDGININSKERNFCEDCAHGKSRRQQFPQERRTKPTKRFEIISSDIKEPFSVPSREGYRYYITFNCLYSTWTGIALIKHKSADEVLNATQEFITKSQAEKNCDYQRF